jgi:hypothetical protein
MKGCVIKLDMGKLYNEVNTIMKNKVENYRR